VKHRHISGALTIEPSLILEVRLLNRQRFKLRIEKVKHPLRYAFFLRMHRMHTAIGYGRGLNLNGRIFRMHTAIGSRILQRVVPSLNSAFRKAQFLGDSTDRATGEKQSNAFGFDRVGNLLRHIKALLRNRRKRRSPSRN